MFGPRVALDITPVESATTIPSVPPLREETLSPPSMNTFSEVGRVMVRLPVLPTTHWIVEVPALLKFPMNSSNPDAGVILTVFAI